MRDSTPLRGIQNVLSILSNIVSKKRPNDPVLPYSPVGFVHLSLSLQEYVYCILSDISYDNTYVTDKNYAVE